MIGNHLLEYRRMQEHRESLLGEAERMRFADQARRVAPAPAPGSSTRTGFRRRNAKAGWRPTAARLGSSLIALGSLLKALDKS